MIQQLSRLQLNQEFRNGERPSGDDFGSAWLSFLHKTDDGVSVDSKGNLEVAKGLALKDTDDNSQAGTIRFKGGQLQVHDGTSFKSVSTGAGGAFTPVGAGPSVAFAGGNVGIGTFAVAPTHRLEVLLTNNSGPDQRVKFGNLAIHAGPSITPGAYISHVALGGSATAYALFQDNQGNTKLNAAQSTELGLAQNGATLFRITGTGGIEMVPTTNVSIGTIFSPKDLSVSGNLTVVGQAFKTGGGSFLPIACDRRVKKDIRPYKDGLQKLVALEPVTFKFNGKAETPDDGRDYMGFVAQDLQKVLPELIVTRSMKLEKNDAKETEILTYDQGPIVFLLINAIKELNARIEKLEKPGSDEKRKAKNTPRAHG